MSFCMYFNFEFAPPLGSRKNSGLRVDSRVPLVVIPEDQCRVKREAKQKLRAALEQQRKANCVSPQPAVSSSESPDDCVALSLETRELINRIVTIDQQFATPSTDTLMKISVVFSKIFENLSKIYSFWCRKLVLWSARIILISQPYNFISSTFLHPIHWKFTILKGELAEENIGSSNWQEGEVLNGI